MDSTDIIKKPVVTEKSMMMMEDNKYTFIVDKRANKSEIKKAIERLFDVEVEKVNTLNRKGKTRRLRGNIGKTPDIKKAVVKLKEGHSIEIFEGM